MRTCYENQSNRRKIATVCVFTWNGALAYMRYAMGSKVPFIVFLPFNVVKDAYSKDSYLLTHLYIYDCCFFHSLQILLSKCNYQRFTTFFVLPILYFICYNRLSSVSTTIFFMIYLNQLKICSDISPFIAFQC